MARKRPDWKTMKADFHRGIAARFFVRFHMALILSATALSGLLFSKILLFLGIVRMDVRFGICTLLSYGCFFLFVKIWLRYVGVLAERRASDSSLDTALDVLDPFPFGGGNIPTRGSAGFDGFGGGMSGGGGAGGDFDGGGATDAGAGAMAAGQGGSGGGSGGASSLAGGLLDGADLDEGLPLLLLALLVALVAAIVGSAFYLIWEAPAILSEAAFQAALASGLITRFRTIDSGSWAGSVFGKTVLPFVVVLCLSVAAGHFAQKWRPDAVRMSEIIESIRQGDRAGNE